VLPLASCAVTVIVCATPAVCVPLPVMTNCVAAPAVGVMLCVAEARPPLANVSVYAVPAVPLMPTPLNVAMPETAATVVVPSVVAPLLTVIVTDALLVVTTLPEPSLMATTGCVVNAAPLAEPAALVVSTSCVAAPALTVTVAGLPLTAVPLIVTPIVGELADPGAVYVAVQTPLTQVKLPSEPALGVATKTADVAPVMMLPKASFTVTVTVAVPFGATVAGLTDSVVVVALAAAALTTTLRRLPPAALSVPSVVATTAVSVFASTIDAVATPFVKVTLVALPKLVAETVGFVLFGATDAPLKVRLFAPVYVVAVLPLASSAVTVIVCATPAVCVPVPVITSCVAVPATTVTVAGLPLIAVPPIVTPIVGEPTVVGAVYVAVHTPLTQVKLPIEPALGVATKTADVAPVMMLPNASLTVTVTVEVPPGPTLAGLADSVDVVALAAAALTTTLRRLPPVALTVPSVVATTAVSVFTSTIDAVATPLVNVTLVALPKLVADTVGFVLFGATAAPLNVKLFEPVYVVAVLPFASCAVTVIVCATPAVCVPAPVITS
jgi:hypothetical protein